MSLTIRIFSPSYCCSCSCQLERIERKVDRIMATEAETLARITEAEGHLDNIKADVQRLLDAVAEEPDEVPASVSDAVDALAADLGLTAAVVPEDAPDPDPEPGEPGSDTISHPIHN